MKLNAAGSQWEKQIRRPICANLFFVGGGGIEYLTSKRSTPQDAFLDVQVKGKFIRVMMVCNLSYKRRQATCIVSPQTKKTSMRIFLTLLHWRVNCKFERQTLMLTKSDCHNPGFIVCLGMRCKPRSLKFWKKKIAIFFIFLNRFDMMISKIIL